MSDQAVDRFDVDPPPVAVHDDRVRVNVWMSRELHDTLAKLARDDEMKLAPFVRQGLKYYARARKEGKI